MSQIEELIQQYCPDGVEWKCLGDFCEIKTGKGITKKDCVEYGEFPIISGGVEPMGYYHTYNREGRTVTISRVGANAGLVSFIEKRFYLNDKCFSVIPSNKTNTKFLYYILSSIESSIKGMQSEGGVPTINTQKVGGIEIPLPPLPVQEEIAKILDSFTELQSELRAELQAELQARRQQYQYYRDKLLSFEGRDDVEWKKLSEVASITTGRRFVRTDIKESGVPCFHYGDIYTYYGLTATKTKGYLDAELASKLRFAQPNDVVVVCAGENDMDLGIGVAWLGKEPAVVHDACCILHHEQNPRYISHFLRTHKYHLQMKRYAKNGKISSLSSSSLGEAIIPIPSLEEQERIASTLDRFDALVNDLSQGLPAEMEARKQQYEYYRDKLLTFKKKA